MSPYVSAVAWGAATGAVNAALLGYFAGVPFGRLAKPAIALGIVGMLIGTMITQPSKKP